ncbi:uncharacterized protein LOC142588602 [Dermacentor variabilis]|uniref:uncharacterized protein LOC142588602 n=1 Tax=Dermacentor variabilis TaxID=34621 RepID=UPI003F5B654F
MAEDEGYFLQTLKVNAIDGHDRFSATVDIAGSAIRCKIDTGATCCVMPEVTLRNLTTKPAQDCCSTLRSFFGHIEKATKKIELQVTSTTQSTTALFFIVKQAVPVTLSGKVAERLGLIGRINTLDALETNEIVERFRDVFQGLGEIKDVAYLMERKPEARGVIKAARRIAIAHQERVRAELDRIEPDGVVAKVIEQTSWSSHMVVVVKKEKVRICLDPSDVNKALVREHYHILTLEDILPRLHGAKFFSTLDASSGFWQIKLDEPSSRLCTMSTPYGR